MKYYIPTSSLNFNNILSTESISPASFYTNRKFGYSRWTLVAENPHQNMVLLYDSPGFFSRPVCDVEDHPLLIEIHTNKDYPRLKDGVYYSERTVYLNALTDGFIFFSESDKRTALSLLDSSSESKMGRMFEGRIVVRDCNRSFPPVPVCDIALSKDGFVEDRHINKVKGLLYGYYIGALLSCNKVDVRRINRYRQLQRIVAAVLSSPSRTPSSSQYAIISELLPEIDPVYVELLKILRGDANTLSQLLSVLREKRGTDPIWSPSRIMRDLEKADSETSEAMRWVGSLIDSAETDMRRNRSYLSVDSGELIVGAGSFERIAAAVIPDSDDNAIVNAWVKDVLSQLKYTGKISSIKAALADDLTTRARDLLGEKWEGSPQRVYLNKLRRHIGGEPFDVAWDNGILSSIAAVLLKGDTWDGLLRFMQTREMTDYRLAMALYGELNGFANLTRDFTDLLLNANMDYVRSVYKKFYGQLYGTSGSDEVEVEYDDSRFVQHPEVLKTNKANSMSERILSFFDSKAFKVRASKSISKESLRNGLLQARAEMGPEFEIEKFLDRLVKDYSSYGWNKKRTPWKKLREKFAPQAGSKGNVKQESRAKTPSLPGMASLLDKEWISECVAQISNPDSKNQFIKDVNKFFVNDSDSKSRWYNPDKSNKAILARLKRWLRMPWETKRLEWKQKYYQFIPLDDIIELLRSRYVK